MSGPERLRLKRKVGDRPPDQLIVEETTPKKRSFTNSEHQRYVLRSDVEPLNSITTPQGPVVRSGAHSDVENSGARRTFRLSRTGTGSLASRKKRRARNDGLVVTVEERAVGQNDRMDVDSVRFGDDHGPPPSTTQPLKRPGRGSAVRPPQQRGDIHVQSTQTSARNGVEQPNVQSIANNLHQFALEELAKTDKPKMTSMPHLTGSQSRDLHRQRTAMAQTQTTPVPAADVDVAMEDEGSGGAYVYDTYVLVPSSETAADEYASGHNVGYIVITDDDAETWEMYMEDETSDKDWDSADEDENAERYHGADYPEDELASDDEDGRGAYGYRNHAGNVEVVVMMDPSRDSRTRRIWQAKAHADGAPDDVLNERLVMAGLPTMRPRTTLKY
nr:hypothetical protein CFP56_24249 [Quercus suber]